MTGDKIGSHFLWNHVASFQSVCLFNGVSDTQVSPWLFLSALHIFFCWKVGFSVLGTEVNIDFGLVRPCSRGLVGALP